MSTRTIVRNWAICFAAALGVLAAVAVPSTRATHKESHRPKPRLTTTLPETTTTTLPETTTTALPETTTTALLETTTTLPETTTTTQPPTTDLIDAGHWRRRTGVTWLDAMVAAYNTYNFDGSWRDFVGPAGSAPLQPDQEAVVTAGFPVQVNWKVAGSGTWAGVAAGSRDSVIIPALQEMQAKCAASQCELAPAHEPENDLGGAGMTAADYVAMWRHLDNLRDVHAPKVKLVWVMMGFEQHRPLYDDLWPGAESVDIIGHDPYITGTADPSIMPARIISRSIWFRANIARLPVKVPEWACDKDVRGTDAHRAACIDAVRRNLPAIADAGVVELSYFDSQPKGFQVNSPPAADGVAYRAFVDAVR